MVADVLHRLEQPGLRAMAQTRRSLPIACTDWTATYNEVIGANLTAADSAMLHCLERSAQP
jgi:hypothetical protein